MASIKKTSRSRAAATSVCARPRVERQRLLAQHRLAGLEARHHGVGVEGVRVGDIDDIDRSGRLATSSYEPYAAVRASPELGGKRLRALSASRDPTAASRRIVDEVRDRQRTPGRSRPAR